MKKLTVFLCLMLSIFSSIYSFDIPVYAGSVSYLYIGDSRTEGMRSSITSDGGYCISKVGANYSYLSKDCLKSMKDTIGKSTVKDWVIVAGFGVNDLGNISKYIDFYKNLESKLPNGKNYTLYLTPVFYVNENKSKVKNKDIDSFNKKLGSIDNGSSIKFLSYSRLMESYLNKRCVNI